jgi:hypothetical protein
LHNLQALSFFAGRCTARGRLALFPAFLALTLTLTGCGTTKSLPEYNASSPAAENARRRPARPSTIGKVSLVNREEKFVLIELQSGRIPTAGMPLQAFSGQMRSAQLKVSKERRPPFLIADIVDGVPQQNDSVMLIGKPGAKSKKPGGGGGGGGNDGTMDYAGPAPEMELLPADDSSFPDQSELLDAGEQGGDVKLPDGPAPMLDPLPPLEPQTPTP